MNPGRLFQDPRMVDSGWYLHRSEHCWRRRPWKIFEGSPRRKWKNRARWDRGFPRKGRMGESGSSGSISGCIRCGDGPFSETAFKRSHWLIWAVLKMITYLHTPVQINKSAGGVHNEKNSQSGSWVDGERKGARQPSNNPDLEKTSGGAIVTARVRTAASEAVAGWLSSNRPSY